MFLKLSCSKGHCTWTQVQNDLCSPEMQVGQGDTHKIVLGKLFTVYHANWLILHLLRNIPKFFNVGIEGGEGGGLDSLTAP